MEENNKSAEAGEKKTIPGGLELLCIYRTEIMGIAALWILLFHVWNPSFHIPIGNGDLLDFFKSIGYYGVDIFFLLSGFGLVFSMKHSTVLGFYRKRILRVYIPFLITGVVLSIVNHWGLIECIKRVSGYSFYHTDVYSLLWFIPAIMTVYLFFPLYYKLLKTARNKAAFTGTVLLIWYFITILWGDMIRWDILHVFLCRLPAFWTGCYLAFAIDRDRSIKWEGWILLLLINLTGICSGWITMYDGADIAELSQFLIAVSVPFLSGNLLNRLEGKKAGKIVRAFLAFFGRISMELYCVQEVIAFNLNRRFEDLMPGTGGRIVLNILTILTATLAGFLFWKFDSMLNRFCEEKKILSRCTHVLQDRVREWIISNRFALILSGECLLVLLYLITPIELKKNYGDGEPFIIQETSRFRTENMGAEAGEYELLLKYRAGEDTEIRFYPYGGEECYPVTLSKDQKELRFPLHLDQNTELMSFDFDASAAETFEIRSIQLIRQSYGKSLHGAIPVLLFLTSVATVYFWPLIRPKTRSHPDY